MDSRKIIFKALCKWRSGFSKNNYYIIFSVVLRFESTSNFVFLNESNLHLEFYICFLMYYLSNINMNQ